MRRADRLLFFAAAALLSTYWFRLVRPTLHVFFSPDDMLGIYRAWLLPVGDLVQANLLFFKSSPFIRPMACAVLRSILHFAGLEAAPFHAVLLAILFANGALTYAAARRLSGSREAAALTVLFVCYHHRFRLIYFDTGFIYDPLCYLFYLGALVLYLQVRQQDRPLGFLSLSACAALLICALNSKEMAVTLAPVLLAYELIYHPLRSWRPPAIGRWILGEGRGILVTGLITLAYVAGRTTGSDSLVSNAMYRPVLSWEQFMSTSRHFPGDVFSGGADWSTAAILLLWAAQAAIAWMTRDRALRFAWLFLMISPLPIAFIVPRGAPQYLIPWFGWTLFGAVALVRGLAWITRRVWGSAEWLSRARGSVVLLGLVLVLYPFNKRRGVTDLYSVTEEAAVNRAVVTQLRSLHPHLPHGSRLLFLNDPIPIDWWNLTFLVQLGYQDRSLEVSRVKRMPHPPTPAERAGYDYVFDFRDGRFMELTEPVNWKRTAPPAFARTKDGAVAIFHGDWSPVTEKAPAKPGETLTARAADVGPTRPEVPPGQPFPAEPFLRVSADVEALVNGRPAEVVRQIGWPREVNQFRLDFTIPAGTAARQALVQLRVDGVAGPVVTIPVR